MLAKVLVIVLLLALMPISSVVAQEDALYEPACDLVQFNVQVDALLTAYRGTRNIDFSTDGALASIAALQNDLDALYADCFEEQQTSRADRLTDLLERLQTGGYILYVRHTHTDRNGPGDTDRPGCETERNLSTRGREEARFINQYYTILQLPISELISTELCRTHDTAALAFGEPDTIIVRSELEATLADVLTVVPPAGTNTLIVAHIGTLDRNFGLPIPFE